MVWYQDLSYFDSFGAKTSKMLGGENYSQILKAVGWLENGKPYASGEAPENLAGKINEFTRTEEICFAFLEVHECDLCNVKLPPRQLNMINGFGSKTCLIAYKNKVFVFPDLIVHYIQAHSYLPPAEFIEAVLTSNPQETIEYFNEIRENRFK